MSVTWGIAEQFRQLLERRELAAYRAVSVISTVIDFWEAQDYDAALIQLQRAQNEFKEADSLVTQFRKSHQGEITHGNSSAA
jgi:hypothetical protein